MGAFANNRYIKAISNGMIFIMTPIIVGSIFTLLVFLPVKPYTEFINAHGLVPILSLPINFTTNIMALLAVFFIAYNLAQQFKKDGSMAGLLALVSFLIITPTGEAKIGDKTISFIAFEWIGAKGLFVAIVVALITARIYIWCQNKGITVKMPDSVPPAVSKSFGGLIPGFITVILSITISGIFKQTPWKSLDQMIYSCIQVPLEGLGGSYGALIIVLLVIGILWFFGIHGTSIVFAGLMSPIYLALDMQNLTAYQAGAPMPNIIGYQFFVCYVIFSGTGATIGMALLMAFRAKSKQYRILGKLAIPTSIFNINEPILFGTPIVLNPYTLLPFLMTPILNSSIAYFVTAIGLVPRLSGVQIPWPTPIIASGIIEGGWRIAILQLVLVAVSIAVYYIPFLVLDKKAQEQAGGNSEEGNQ